MDINFQSEYVPYFPNEGQTYSKIYSEERNAQTFHLYSWLCLQHSLLGKKPTIQLIRQRGAKKGKPYRPIKARRLFIFCFEDLRFSLTLIHCVKMSQKINDCARKFGP